MSRKSLVPVNLLTSAAAPTLPTLRAGDTYYNTTDNKTYTYTGSAWVAVNLLLSTATPQALGVASAGSGTSASKDDHVHPTTGVAVLASANTFTDSQTVTSLVVTGSTAPANGVYLPAANSLGFATNSTAVARFNSTGQLLLGKTTASSVAQLNRLVQVEGTSASTTGVSIIRNSNDASAPRVEFGKSRGTTVGAVTSVASGDEIGGILSNATDGTSYVTGVASVNFLVDGTVSTGVVPTRMTFYTSSSSGVSTERMRIDSAGLVGINTTPSGTQLHVINSTAANVGVIVKGAASQSGDLQQWQNSAGTTLVSINSSGNVGLGVSPSYKFQVVGSSGAVQTSIGTTANQVSFNGFDNDAFYLTLASTNSLSMGLGTQQSIPLNFLTANTVRMTVGATGLVGINVAPSGTQLHVVNSTAANVGAIIKAAASQSGSLQEWQNSAGTVLTKIASDGSATVAVSLTLSAANIITDTTTGTKIGTATNQKLGFFNATPVVQPASPTGDVSVSNAGSTNTVYRNTIFTGGTGTTGYTIGDVVKALKNLGLLAA